MSKHHLTHLERKQQHQHQMHVKKIRRMIFWGLVAGLVVFTGHEVAGKIVEFIAASILDVIIQWE